VSEPAIRRLVHLFIQGHLTTEHFCRIAADLDPREYATLKRIYARSQGGSAQRLLPSETSGNRMILGGRSKLC